MLGLAEVVGAQPNCWPNVRFEHDAGETAGNQDRNWAPAGPRVPWGCLLKILVASCGLAPSCIMMTCVQVHVFVHAQLLTVDHSCMKVCKHTDQHAHAHLHLQRC